MSDPALVVQALIVMTVQGFVACLRSQPSKESMREMYSTGGVLLQA